MSDFNFPYSLPNRSSSRNDLGFGTILGNASPVSPRWSYLRDRPWPDDEDDTDDAPRRGAAPNVEPPPGSPEFQAAEASLPEPQGGTPGQQIETAGTLALGLDMAESQVGARLAAVMTRAAPVALATAPPVAAALPLVAFPTFNSDGETLPIGDRFRVSQPPGQAEILERRISDGLLGTSVGAKWEQIPSIQPTLRIGPYGLRTAVVDADQLHDALGPDLTNQLFATGRVIDQRAADQMATGARDDQRPPPLSLPSKIEMQIWASTDQGFTTTAREASREQVEQVCPNFPNTNSTRWRQLQSTRLQVCRTARNTAASFIAPSNRA